MTESELPVTERHELSPLSPYAVSKVAQDMLAYQYFRSYGIPCVRVRAFNHDGPRRGEVFVTSAFARQIAENAPQSLAGMKAAIARMISLREQIPHDDIDALARQAHRSEDAKEGAAAMLEKRKPAFKGR